MAAYTYDAQVLRRLQLTQLEVYKVFAAFCEKHGLTQFAIYGTTLGAVRHQGFIPWDDDMDIGMPREDYEKFITLAHEEFAEGYEVLDLVHTEGYTLPFAKVSKKNTTFVEDAASNRKYHCGIYIDVYPFDETASDPEEQKKHWHTTYMWARLIALAEYAKVSIPEGMHPVVKAVCSAGCVVAHGIMKVLGLNRKRMYRCFMKAATKYNGKNTGWSLDATTVDVWNTIIPTASLVPVQMMPFEDVMMPQVANTDDYLVRYYDDYMAIPPEEKRHMHPPAVLDFDQ